MSDPKCKDELPRHYKSTMADIRTLWELYKTDPDASDEELGNFSEYGLAFDYVPAGTFNDQKRGFFRYQLSCGGPQEEFRYFCDEGFSVTRVEFWFLNWFDGAKKILQSNDLALMLEIWNDWRELGVVESEYKKATTE